LTVPGFGNATYNVTDVIPDPTEAGWFWETNSIVGLLKFKTDTSQPQQFQVNGPVSVGCAQVQIKDDKVIIAPTFLGYQKGPSYLPFGVSSFFEGIWKGDIHSPPNNIIDIDCIAFDYKDKNHFYAGSFGNGLIEVKNDSMVAQYTYSNSIIPPRDFSGNTTVQVTSLFSDINNNLWITTNDNAKFVTIKKSDNTWASLNFSNLVPNIVTNNPYLNTDQILVDSSNMVYVASYGTGIFVYKNDGNFSQPNASNSKLLTNATGKGGLPSLYPMCIAEDKTGDLWVGTDQGIYVFYNPGSILSQTSGWDAQPIYVQQNGQTQLLLATDNVSCIFVDGANNKWVGTITSGLFCFSPDGQKQLYNFNILNSPLFSNNIIDVKVNPKNGEVFIATDKGLQSFQNTTTEGLASFENVYAYPNPVKPGYSGPILIHGMISGATVKIIDAGGNFVFETTSEGGQATWNGQNFKGQRVASGVYMVICATPDGSQKKLTKILLLN
ncbi:MAG TPA: two-component regulator propeller domain-containing protein, partial [Bacteroidia bacterium]